MQISSRSGESWTIIGRWAAALGGVLIAVCAGCGSTGKVGISPTSAAAKAMELYDANKDGALDTEELKKCPPLAASLQSYDSNGDGKIGTDEIATRLASLLAGGNNLAGVTISVTLDGQPLPGANVRLRPAEFLGSELDVAEGVADDVGTVQPTIPAEHLPAEFSNSPLVQKIPYVVEITHPDRQLPAKYNTASELGFEVDPSSRNGLSTRFDLKSK